MDKTQKNKQIPNSAVLFYALKHFPLRDKCIMIKCNTYEDLINISNKLFMPHDVFESIIKERKKQKYTGFDCMKYYKEKTNKMVTVANPEDGFVLYPCGEKARLLGDKHSYNPFATRALIQSYTKCMWKPSCKQKVFSNTELYLVLNMSRQFTWKTVSQHSKKCIYTYDKTGRVELLTPQLVHHDEKEILKVVDVIIDGTILDQLTNKFPEIFCKII